MTIFKRFLIASSVLGLSLAVPSLASANACLKKVKDCELSCTKNHNDFLSVLNCKVQECKIAKVCSASNSGTDRSSNSRRTRTEVPKYEAPKYEAPKYEPRAYKPPSPPPTTTPNQRQERSSEYSKQSQNTQRSRAELKEILSQKGGAEAKNCITLSRGDHSFFGPQTRFVRNKCSKAIIISWCYPKVANSSILNIHKCDIGGRFGYSGTDTIGAYEDHYFQDSRKATLSFGVCIKDLVLDGKTYTQPYPKRTGENIYECSYIPYGR